MQGSEAGAMSCPVQAHGTVWLGETVCGCDAYVLPLGPACHSSKAAVITVWGCGTIVCCPLPTAAAETHQ